MSLADELVEEAVVRSPEGGAIGITVQGQEGTVVLAVHDEGTAPREEVALQMGLARSMVEAVGGTVRIENEQGYVVEVSFPQHQ
jgi:two-component sensor histidine kinase